MRPLLLLPLFLLSFPASLRAQHAKAGELLTAKFGAGGTWNLYMASEKPLTWVKAQALAEEKVDPAGNSGKKGHLIAISSAAENQFAFHFVRGTMIWTGLTDSEKFAGAAEAGSSQEKGWAWVNGEPLTWMNWQSAQPTDDCEFPGSKGEDAVAIEANGYWNDRANGSENQPGSSLPFLIEWDVQSKEPVAGARVIGAVLPEKWPELKAVPEGGDEAPWVCVSTSSAGSDPRMFETLKTLTEGWEKAEAFRMKDIYFQIPTTDPAFIFGWIFGKPVEFPGTAKKYFGMIARARLVIPKAGTYTFNIHMDDAFALRLGNHPWKAAAGQGGINPVNPATLHTLLMASDAETRGVIDLPAGEVPVELFYINGGAEGRCQILTAEGTHLSEGSTSEWRMLGHKAAADKVRWPGMTAEGWKVTIPPPQEQGWITPRDQVINRLVRVDDEGCAVTKGLEVINFQDAECGRRLRFPDAVPFPGDPAGVQDDRVILAEGMLDIPADGLYHIGISGDDLGALQLPGKKWEKIVRDSSGRYAKVDDDTIFVRKCDNSTSHDIIGEVKLTKGQHAIRAVSWDRNGASAMQIFAAPAGWPGRLLKKGGMVEEGDVAGLEVKGFKP